MLVVVASHNPVKIAAVRQSFDAHFGVDTYELVSVSVESGVGDQPKSDTETRQGAENRANHAALERPEADYCVGLEGGVETVNDQLMAFAWMAVRNSAGRISEARTVTLPLPDEVRKLLEQGLELGDANDTVFGTVGSKLKGGAYGLLTKGQFTRESVYTEALTIALIPFVNAAYANGS